MNKSKRAEEKLKSLKGKLNDIKRINDYQTMIDKIQSLGHSLREKPPNSSCIQSLQKSRFRKILSQLRSSFKKMWHVWVSIAIIAFTIWVNLYFGQTRGSEWDADHELWCFGAGLVAVSFLIGLCTSVEAKTWNYILTGANVFLVIATGILMHYEKCLAYM